MHWPSSFRLLCRPRRKKHNQDPVATVENHTTLTNESVVNATANESTAVVDQIQIDAISRIDEAVEMINEKKTVQDNHYNDDGDDGGGGGYDNDDNSDENVNIYSEKQQSIRRTQTRREKVESTPFWARNRVRLAVHNFLSFLGRGNQQEPPYPWKLERHYHVSNKKLGIGSFAEVRECTEKRTGEKFAIKIILKKSIQGKEHMLDTELGVLKRVSHPHVIRLHDLYESKKAVYIITDLAPGGDLFTHLSLKGSFTERDASVLIYQVLEGVKYLHEHEIVHRDLKPENLLFMDDSETPKLVITDFGLSKILTNYSDILMTACGTPQYVAPEVLLQKGHGKPVDIWSVGVIMYMLLCGYTPFSGEDQGDLFSRIMSGGYEFHHDYWADVSNEAKDLIRCLLEYDPALRISAREALSHQWFITSIDSDRDLLSNIRNSFEAKATFKKAVNVVQSVNRLRRESNTANNRESTEIFLGGPAKSESAKSGIAGIVDMIADIERVRNERVSQEMSRQKANRIGKGGNDTIVEGEEDSQDDQVPLYFNVDDIWAEAVRRTGDEQDDDIDELPTMTTRSRGRLSVNGYLPVTTSSTLTTESSTTVSSGAIPFMVPSTTTLSTVYSSFEETFDDVDAKIPGSHHTFP